ncbi:MULTISPECIES: helix-turn-helix transcriptional regulator [Henriciella]|uniref:helix-turn-helix transcriptional regulator n=1 Tax=Henriciella TaxID=453849 RepID=UPI0035163D79
MPEPNIIRLERIGGASSNHRRDSPTRFLSLRQVLDRTSISRSLVYQLIKDRERPFPAPVHIGRRSVWLECEVETYMRHVVEAERS